MKKPGEAVLAFLKVFGTGSIKKKVWDAEFERGKWDYLERTGDDKVGLFVSKYLNGGSLLDLGCGPGGPPGALKALNIYTGVDISQVAIDKARSGGGPPGAAREFFAADITEFKPSREYDVILMKESLYYIKSSRIKDVLARYSGHLKKGGVFIVRLWDRKRYSKIVGIIRRGFNMVEEYAPEENNTAILVFNPKGEA